ncbi:hypothetical protein DPMN_175821 [Dreissena polymorpha]|uniref:C-type lectin domain-containing protein n=1 Tax=Dreissena polymorpha TaxID=45954 RepID=A0A9D4IIL4_DREPO|nr:hypothetical protein DPMN_175821 [Dreissena polymorpha]
MPDHLNWANSKENCESFGWKLASAESSSLLNRTKTLMQGNDFWLGATKESGVWRWLSGVPMSTLPIEDHIDTCLLIWRGRLDDGNCVNNWKMHVCEISF